MRKFLITVNGTQYDVAVEEVNGAAPAVTSIAPAAPVASAAPVAPAAPVAAPAAPAAPVAAAPAGGESVTAPFPGMIKKLCVPAGTKVKAGDLILILEAMKMDNDITAPCDGVVSFPVQTGASVETDAVIAVIG